jgi:hypothetical protein
VRPRFRARTQIQDEVVVGKSFLKETPQAVGVIPACTGALCTIKELEKTKTKIKEGKKAKKMFVATLEVQKPKGIKGMTLREYYVIGTEDDPMAKNEETWARSEAGPGRLARLLNKANVEIDDEDDQLWCDAATSGDPIVVPIVHRPDTDGTPRAQIGLAFAPDDEDCPEVGFADEATSKGSGGKGAAAASKSARGRRAVEEDGDEAPKKDKAAAADDDDDAPKRGKGKKKAAADEDDD